jgi:hypothetical protein
MSTPEDNIKVILADWLDALSRHDLDAMERRMAPDVFWQGIREDFVCVDREEAMKLLREQQSEDYGVEALELVGTEEKVMLGVRSVQLQEVGASHLEARSSRSLPCTTASSSGWTSTSGVVRR